MLSTEAHFFALTALAQEGLPIGFLVAGWGVATGVLEREFDGRSEPPNFGSRLGADGNFGYRYRIREGKIAAHGHARMQYP